MTTNTQKAEIKAKGTAARRSKPRLILSASVSATGRKKEAK